MTRDLQRAFIVAGCAFACWPAHAFIESSHRFMSEMAVKASVLSSQDKLNQLGFRYGVDGKNNQTFPVSKEDGVTQENILGAVSFGADYEDSGPMVRVVNHFFNPLTNLPLKTTVVVPPIVGVHITVPPSNETSPNWALEDNGSITYSGLGGAQNNSYLDAKEYFLNALIKPTKAERDTNWGLTFQSLGQIIHHLQDMTQPQHVRNDLHLNLNEIGLPNIPGITHPSMFERYVALTKNADTFAGYPAYAPVYSPSDIGNFKKPRDFWTTSEASIGTGGKGIAEYTNRNFFSIGTLPSLFTFTDLNFPAPVPGSSGVPQDIAALCTNAVPACPAGVWGLMSFTSTTVTDNLRPGSQVNPRAMAQSLYNSDLTSRGFLPTSTLNRFTYDAAAEILIPRAIGYSAGLLNYFFRGQMEITLPDAGIYAVVDHAIPAGNDKYTGGFSNLKLKIKNTTPGTGSGGVEPMGNGQGVLYAVVKFHRNLCYQADLSGEYGAPGMDWKLCRDPNEEVVVSTLAFSPSGIDSAPQQLTFTFPTPIPISATDVFLQVVYKGTLGDEMGAVVVATKDISEPNYGSFYDLNEQLLHGGGLKTFKAAYCDPYPLVSYEDCKIAFGSTTRYYRFSPPTNYDPANPSVTAFAPTITFDKVTVSRFTRVAFLADHPNQPYTSYMLQKTQLMTNDPILDPVVYPGGHLQSNQLDTSTTPNVLNPPAFQLWRGIFIHTEDYNRFVAASQIPLEQVPPMVPVTPMPSVIDF